MCLGIRNSSCSYSLLYMNKIRQLKINRGNFKNRISHTAYFFAQIVGHSLEQLVNIFTVARVL